MALLEAMAAGRAIVASRVGGIPEVIHDEIEGLLVEPRDVQGLANKCLQLIESPDLASRVGISARRRVERDFSAQSMAKRVALLYDELIKTGSGL
jgi:glycosyltransferase involved in cell wall biosynthesis